MKINVKAIGPFSYRLSEIIESNYFNTHDRITGSDILSLTPIKQINLFVLKHILDIWDEEVNKLKSPFFDYENGEVKDALEEFMNKLSFHIKVKQKDFGPILSDSIQDTMLLTLDPSTYFNQVLEDKGFDHILKNKKYFVNNRFIVDAIDKSNDHNSFSVDDFIRQASGNLHDVHLFFEEFSTLLPVNEADFILSDDEDEERSEEPTMVEMSVTENEVDTKTEDHTKNDLLAEEVNEDLPAISDPIETPISENNTTLNEQFHKEEKPSLLDDLQKKKSGSFISQLGFNQRLMFITKLFGENNVDFANCVSELENYESYESASNYLISNFAQKYDWNNKEEEVGEFLDLVSRQY